MTIVYVWHAAFINWAILSSENVHNNCQIKPSNPGRIYFELVLCQKYMFLELFTETIVILSMKDNDML